jgi:CBS domain-containing protein
VTEIVAARLFKHEQVLPVVIDNRLVGILTYQEARRVLEQGDPVTVAHVMLTDVPALQLRDTLWVALRIMNSCQLARLPVVDAGVFRGVINLGDIDHAWQYMPTQQDNAEHSLASDHISQ